MNRQHNQFKPNQSQRRQGRAALGLGVLLLGLAGLMLAVGIGRVVAGERPQSANDGQPHATVATLPLPTTRQDFFLPGTQPGGLDDSHPLIDPTTCDACHTDPIYKAWRGSMMGQAGRDPVFWAAFAVAQNDAADAGEYCLRCHTPTAWYDERDHALTPGDLTPADINAGLACEVCHRMVDPVSGATDETAAIVTAIRAALTDPPPSDHFRCV